VIAGGGTADGRPRYLGVFLNHDPKDFGVAATRSARPVGKIRTGLSEALATDAQDDSYDLSWLARLPSDPLAAIEKLRALLVDERDPIDRHFMFHHLEECLYKARDSFRSALDEFDVCCATHDEEMESIRDAFMTKWQQVPWLHTYKQMCIRLSKAKRHEEGLRWAERGLRIYGENASCPEAVEDLEKRAAAFREKMT
jgi:hypothetical protein